ncbi:hypothetical protein BLNAU_25051 [Blattamonas nauphoetae]|uniref:Uncharacterized protein n=1 Tax=Blattamonas nauphoetae TaxID=2049346 RepID=A0ABQ9WPS5_9EUKA|nr:hypothetical protein BLNAU_25051 [Blattamonas nauphoetae]
MKTCLGHGLNIVNKQLQLLVAQVIGKQPLPEFTNDDRAHLIDQYGTNPLLSPWHRLMLIPFFLDVSQNQERNNLIVKLKESSDSSLEQHEIDFLYAFLTIQAPLDDQETTNLRSVVENNFKDPSKTELINLIKGELPSGEGTFHRLPNTSEYKTKWCDTMNRLENNQHYNLDRAFLGYCLETQHPLKDSKKDRLISLIDNSTLPAKEKNTLHVLITGKPIYSQFRRETIVSYYLYLPFNHNSSLLDQIKNSPSLSEQKKAEKIELATTELARSDLEIATEFVRHPLKSAERDLNLLFKILKGEEHVSQRRRQQLITKIRHIQQSIIQTKKDMCVRLGKDGRLSWMDLASLLCSPNGDQSQYLVAIRSFDENNPLDTKGLDDVAIDGIYDNDLGIERTGTPPNRPTNQLGDSPYHEEPSTPLPFPHRSIVITPKNTIDKRSGSDDPENQ